MKTQEQIKQEVVNYLTKTSQHTFAYEDGSIFKVEKVGDKFYLIDQKSYKQLSEIEYEKTMAYYMNNAKCVLKHRLFLGRPIKSVKTNKYTKEIVESIINPSKNKATV
jgi:hypothetical protein